jgi:hypothetical protein
MLLLQRFALLVAVAGVLSLTHAWGSEEPAPAGASTAAKTAEVRDSGTPSNEEIAKLVAQLDAERYADRQAASEKLEAIGRPAIPELAKAAVGESLEANVRAMELLAKFLESSDAATKEAAKAALETIAKSERQAAAGRATDALSAEESQRNPQNAQLNTGQIIIGGGGIQLDHGGFTRKSVKIVNGAKQIDVSGDGKTIKISDSPKDGIKIEVTKKNKEGKEETEKYEAKDVAELKRKQPAGYKIYKEHGDDARRAAFGITQQIQVGPGGGIQVLPGQPGNLLLPLMPGLPKVLGVPPGGEEGVDQAAQLSDQLAELFDGLAKGDGLKNVPQADKDELQKCLGELKQRIAKLEKRLQEKASPPATEKTQK